MTIHVLYTYSKPTHKHINENIQDMESGSSREQPQFYKETRKVVWVFFYTVVLSVRPSLACTWKKSVLSVSRIPDLIVTSVADTCAAPHCSAFLCRLGARGTHHDQSKANLVTLDLEQGPQRWLLEKCTYTFQIDLFSALFKSCSLYLDKCRPGFSCCGVVSLLNRSHFAKEEGEAPILLPSCHLSPGVQENQKASPQILFLFHSDTTEQNRISFKAVTGQALQHSYKGEFRCQGVEFPNAFPFLHLFFFISINLCHFLQNLFWGRERVQNKRWAIQS